MIARIGKYTVESEVGCGGFGRVYKAWDPDVRQAVAIKVLLAEGDPDLLKRFQLEVVTTASLHHKNIVTTYASGEEAGTPYLVMEFLEGQTLAQIIRQQIPLTVMTKVRIMTQVAEGLAYAHSKGVVHRDVKPANIMLQPDGDVKIMDFGIALASSRQTLSMTMDGFVVGTVPYMSPEQFTSDAKANQQTDIFSFGSVYYELLTGKHPFEPFTRDLNALRMAILTYDPPPITEAAPECPEALETLVHRSLAKGCEFRYQTFEELRLDSATVLVDLQHERAAVILEEVLPLLSVGNLQEARARVREAQQLEPGNRRARQLLETIDQKLQETQNRERVAAKVTEAAQQLSERRFAEAVQSLEMAAKLDTANVTVQMRLAEAKVKLDGALQANRLVEDARARQQRGEFAEALERLDRAIQLDPEHTGARRLLPKVSEQLKRRQGELRLQQALRAASEHLAGKRYVEALEALGELEREQPGAPEIAQLRHEIEDKRSDDERRGRAQEFQLAAAGIGEAMHAGELERAGQMLAQLNSSFVCEPASAEALTVLRQRLNALLRAQEIADVLERSNSLRHAGDLQGALGGIAEGRKRLGEEAAFRDFERQLEADLALARAKEHRVETEPSAPAEPAPVNPKRPLPWKLMAAGSGVAIVVAAVVLAPGLSRKRQMPPAPIRIEIRTDPPGAAVRLGNRSCETPNCRMELAPGSYQVEAQLKDYAPMRQTVLVDASKSLLVLTLEPLPEPKAGEAPPQTGVLVVQAGVPDALVFVDGIARSRTDQSGSLTLSLEAKSHEVQVERNGFESPAPRKVTTLAGSQETLVFSLAPRASKLESRGAPSGTDVRTRGKSMGITDGSGAAFPGPATPPPAAEMLEREQWERIRATSDIEQLRGFLRSYPNGAHAKDAELRIGDLQWKAVDQTNVEIVRKFLRDNPENPHRSEAQRVVDQLEERERLDQAKQDTIRKQELARQESSARLEQLARRQAFEAVKQLDTALQSKRARDVKAIWPSASQLFLESVGKSGVKMSLSAREADIQILQQPDRATIPCNLVSITNGTTRTQKASLFLRNKDGVWTVETAKFD